MSYAPEPNNHVEDQATHGRLLENINKDTSGPSLLPKTHAQRFLFFLKTTGLWAAGGIAFMVTGISIADIFIRYWVYICPDSARCPHSFNPDNDFLQVIRTVMQYWLQIGMIVFGVGLVKLVAYQAWSGMRQRGNTIDNITLNVGVINGSAYNAGKLLFLKRNRFLGGFFLVHFAIITAISLVVGFSISTLKNYKEHEVRIQLSHEGNHFRHL